MKLKLIGVALGSSILTAVAFAAAIPAKTYQVTGPVQQFTNDVIVVQKGNEYWEIGRSASTKVKGDLVPGATVTITYRMLGLEIEVKPAKAAAPAKPAAAAKPAAKAPAKPK